MNEPPHPLEKFFLKSRLQRIDRVLETRTRNLVVVLDNVQNHHNISAVLRSADAFGLQNIYLVGDNFTYAPGISLGTEQWLTLKRFSDPESCIQELKNNGYEIVLLQAEELSKKVEKRTLAVNELPFNRKLAMVFGNEHKGVSAMFQDSATYLAHIPMVGFVESLNISVAAAITFYTAYLAKRPPFSDEERRKLREEWMVKDLRGGEEILKRVKE